jgi:hypothetical protein
VTRACVLTRVFLTAAPMMALAACGEPQPSEAVIVRDSGGVTIVENFTPEWSEGAEWWVERQPTVVLDGFADVTGAALLGDGTVVVLDAVTHELRFYGADGRLLTATGREGAGPGEFASPTSLARYRGDSVAVFDPALGRISLFSRAGRFARSVPARLATGRMEFVGTLGDGGFVIRGGGFEPHGGTWREPATLVRIAPNGDALDTLLVVPGEEFYSIRFEGRPVYGIRPFGRHTVAVAADDDVIVNLGDDCSLTVVNPSGLPLLHIRVPCTPRRLPSDAIEAFERARLAGMRVRRSREFLAAVYRAGKVPYPKEAAPYDRLLADDAGYIWARRSVLPGDTLRQWFVFRRDGRLLGTVTTPVQLDIQQIARHALAAVVLDDLGRARLELHRLVRRGRRTRTIGWGRYASPHP